MNKLIKIVGLSILMMGSALQAMDRMQDCAGQGAMASAVVKKIKQSDLNEQLIEAATCGRVQQVEKLIEDGANVNAQNEFHLTALTGAADQGHKHICELLIDKGVDVNMPGNSGWTALMCAAVHGYKAICTLLIAKGANLDIQGVSGVTALAWAAASGKQEICELLIAGGADVNVQGDRTALMWAAARGRYEICELLIASGADVKAQGANGWTALMFAASKGSKKICELLLAHGADVNVQTEYGYTALSQAVKFGEQEICELLIKAMIKPTEKQFNAIQTFLRISKKRRSEYLKLIGRDATQLIFRELINEMIVQKKIHAESEITKIEDGDKALKADLLQYLNTL